VIGLAQLIFGHHLLTSLVMMCSGFTRFST